MGVNGVNRVVIGIDADVHRIAYAAVRGGKVVEVDTIERANARGRIWPDYDQALAEFMRRAASARAMVYLEGIYLGSETAGPKGQRNPKRNVDAFRRLAETQGEIKRAARVAGVRVEVVAPSTWQSAVLGITRGRETIKAKAAEIAAAHWPGKMSQHECDAVCLGLFGCGTMKEAV